MGAEAAGGDATWLGYLRAAAEAATIGGLADWFAVTALFRHPLGIPIPHTAIVPNRKEQFGATLGEFVQDSFLTPDVVGARVLAAAPARRAGAWLSTPAGAERVAELAADLAVAAAGLVDDAQVHRLADELTDQALERLPLAPLAGRGLAAAMEGDRHHDLVTAALQALDRFLDEHRDELRDRVAAKAPWWMPGAVEDRIFERLLDGARRLVRDVAADPDHELRHEADRRLRDLAERLQTSEDLRRRGQELAAEVLGSTRVRAWAASVWHEVEAGLRAQAADPASELRRRLAGTASAAGRRLLDDAELAGRLDQGLERAARYAVAQGGDEVADLVTTTIRRWDTAETTERLELLLGPDLQVIRINGTVVGGLAGLVLHAVAEVV